MTKSLSWDTAMDGKGRWFLFLEQKWVDNR